MKNARERLANLDVSLANERAMLEKCELLKVGVQREITELEETVEELKVELGEIQEVLEEKNKGVESVKKTTLKASKVLDLSLKEIANCVCWVSFDLVRCWTKFSSLDRTMKLRSWLWKGRRSIASVG